MAAALGFSPPSPSGPEVLTKSRKYSTLLLSYITIRLFTHTMTDDQLSATFAALADPTRRAILARLTTGQKTVTELAEPFEISQPAISKHLKVLEKVNLVERTREAQYRPRTLNAQPLKEIDEWMERYRRFFEESFDRLDDYLVELQAKEKDDE